MWPPATEVVQINTPRDSRVTTAPSRDNTHPEREKANRCAFGRTPKGCNRVMASALGIARFIRPPADDATMQNEMDVEIRAM